MTIYTWDETKRRSNLRKHGLDFVDAPAVFDWWPVTYEDTRFRYGERRFNTIGIFHGDIVVITYTESDDEIRIISFRKADKREASRFYLQ